MQTINIHEAKTHFSRLLEQVAGGEEIIIANENLRVRSRFIACSVVRYHFRWRRRRVRASYLDLTVRSNSSKSNGLESRPENCPFIPVA